MVIENTSTLELRGRNVMSRSSHNEWCKTSPREILAPWWGRPKVSADEIENIGQRSRNIYNDYVDEDFKTYRDRT